MLRIDCHDFHGTEDALCTECQALHDYAMARLDRCPFQEEKSTCVHCAVHCYKPAVREEIRKVMRYAGPRMMWRHPYLAVRHVLDGAAEKPRRGSNRRGNWETIWVYSKLVGTTRTGMRWGDHADPRQAARARAARLVPLPTAPTDYEHQICNNTQGSREKTKHFGARDRDYCGRYRGFQDWQSVKPALAAGGYRGGCTAVTGAVEAGRADLPKPG